MGAEVKKKKSKYKRFAIYGGSGKSKVRSKTHPLEEPPGFPRDELKFKKKKKSKAYFFKSKTTTPASKATGVIGAQGEVHPSFLRSSSFTASSVTSERNAPRRNDGCKPSAITHEKTTSTRSTTSCDQQFSFSSTPRKQT